MPRDVIVVLKTGSTIPEVRHRGDFEDWIAAGLERPVATLDAQNETLPDLDQLCDPVHGIVVTGSPSSVTEHAGWMLRAGRWLCAAVERDVPLLGICFGHQLMAEALGGRVITNPLGREIGTHRITLLEAAQTDPLLGVLAGEVLAQTSHSDTVSELPPNAVRLAHSALDDCHAFRVRERRAWGVQFHPEFDADIVRGYIRARADELRAEGLDPERAAAEALDSDVGPTLLRRFSALIG